MARQDAQTRDAQTRDAQTRAHPDGIPDASQHETGHVYPDATRGAHPASASLLHSASADETRRLGALLGSLLRAGDIVLLTGALGAGKTAFTQGIGAGLGITGPINSPTFTLIKEYAGRLPLYHFDLYRIDEPDELFALGFEEYFGGDGVAVVEWAERGESGTEGALGAPWPEIWLRVCLAETDTEHPNERTLSFAAAGQRGRALLAEFVAAADSAAQQSGATTEGA